MNQLFIQVSLAVAEAIVQQRPISFVALSDGTRVRVPYN